MKGKIKKRVSVFLLLCLFFAVLRDYYRHCFGTKLSPFSPTVFDHSPLFFFNLFSILVRFSKISTNPKTGLILHLFF
ncbi:hypothetical protein FPG87_03870 [Flavobacterium psychrophilum]|nr:hypothetical protein FPG87_03870 [Flavobacterium psychrophilum]